MFLDVVDPHIKNSERSLDASLDYRAATKEVSVKFDLLVENDDKHMTVDIVNGGTRVHTYESTDAAFQLCARQEQWEQFFQVVPKPPFQSFWGMLRTIGPENGVSVRGDTVAFARYARVWRLLLDVVRQTVTNTKGSTRDVGEVDTEDHITGRYIHTNNSLFGQARVFVESAGSGPQSVLFLHTAGSDSRQYHGVMNMPTLQSRFTMHAFDLPGHGRSDLGTKQTVGDFTLTEETYLSIIEQVIQKLNLSDVVVCGASMAGQICLAVGLNAKKLGVKGIIPCEACEHIPYKPAIYGYQGADGSVLNPETVCGMMSPTSPEHHKRQVWWGYSSQGIGVFKGDLKFYFQGWDGRGRMKDIECPVYMLTGEYDYSCSPEMSQKTFEAIQQGQAKDMAMFEVMPGLGHFPASENPPKFVEYFLRAADYIDHRCSSAL